MSHEHVQGFKEDQISVKRYLNLRYDGTDVPVMTSFAADGTANPAKAFEEQYKREFGFVLEVSSCCLVCRCLPRMCVSFVQNGACFVL
jgi:N-methylhydantoinase A/oxoprolinase/acetone carboxylase beta subunit